MNNGIFCKPKISTDVHNSILIDEYHKCIFGDAQTQEPSDINTEKPTNIESGQLEETSLTMSSGNASCSKAKPSSISTSYTQPSTFPPKVQKWIAGMNVQAPSTEDDGQYFEAIILNIYDDKYASIEFVGYGNEEVVKLKDLKQSKGEVTIKKQIAKANKQYDDFESDNEVIDWEVGMPCRAYYQFNDVIYEATIEKVDLVNRIATVALLGYNVKYAVDFDHLYKSDPSLREKQEKMAAQHQAEKANRTLGVPLNINIPAKEIKTINIPRPKIIQHNLPEVGHCISGFQPSQSDNPSCNRPQSGSLLQPKDEKEALACLVSANYLCGYYAGYLDCLNKVKEQNEHKS